MQKSTADYNNIKDIALYDVTVLKSKGESYGDSWKQRGGVGAFMMLARKWDRVENICRDSAGYDAFKACGENIGDVLDDIADLRRYLLLLEDEVRRNHLNVKDREFTRPKDGGQAGPEYVNQDGKCAHDWLVSSFTNDTYCRFCGALK